MVEQEMAHENAFSTRPTGGSSVPTCRHTAVRPMASAHHQRRRPARPSAARGLLGPLGQARAHALPPPSGRRRASGRSAPAGAAERDQQAHPGVADHGVHDDDDALQLGREAQRGGHRHQVRAARRSRSPASAPTAFHASGGQPGPQQRRSPRARRARSPSTPAAMTTSAVRPRRAMALISDDRSMQHQAGRQEVAGERASRAGSRREGCRPRWRASAGR